MFGFGKKEKKDKKRTEPELDAELKAFAADYEPEELDILAVTGPVGFGGVKRGSFWQASIGLTAWMVEDSPTSIRRRSPCLPWRTTACWTFYASARRRILS